MFPISIQVCYFNFWWIFSSSSLYVIYALLQKSSRQKIWDRCTPFFGMLVFVVCIVACFNEVLLLAFVHYSFTSVSICQNLLIELVDRLNHKICKGTNFCIIVNFMPRSESYSQGICYFLDGLAWLRASRIF